MLNFKIVVLIAGLLALSSCSPPEPAPQKFTLVGQRPAKAEESENTLEQATEACKQEAQVKTLGSVVGVFSYLRRGMDKEFVTCMKERGYEATH